MKMSKSPFYYGGVVRDEYFCNRSKETKEQVADIDSGWNILSPDSNRTANKSPKSVSMRYRMYQKDFRGAAIGVVENAAGVSNSQCIVCCCAETLTSIIIVVIFPVCRQIID